MTVNTVQSDMIPLKMEPVIVAVINRPIVLYPLHPKQGIVAVPNYLYYHKFLEASVPTNDKT
jgi:hypothetical protein